MKCPNCGKELQPNWKNCPSCGAEISQSTKCPSCNNSLEADWKSCPYCGLVTGKTPNISASIKDSVVKEIHQTQNIYNESRTVGTPEYEYEKYVLAVLGSGGSLERAKTQLEQRRQQLGLSIKQSKEIESHCLTEVNGATIEAVDKNGFSKGDITMKACTKCGKLVSDQAKFCDNCGASLSSNVESFTTRSQATQTPSSNIKRKIKQLCPFCQGTGLQPGATFTNQKCPTCKGYRYNLIEEGSPQCAICHGSGRVKAQGMVLMGPNFVRCPACGGTGADQDL